MAKPGRAAAPMTSPPQHNQRLSKVGARPPPWNSPLLVNKRLDWWRYGQLPGSREHGRLLKTGNTPFARRYPRLSAFFADFSSGER